MTTRYLQEGASYGPFLLIGKMEKANFLKDKIIDGTELSISKVIESTINEKAKKHGYKNGKTD